MGWPYKTVLMIGCTAGLGQAMAERMISHGSFVIAVGRRKDRLEAFAAKHGSDRVSTSQFDVTNLNGITAWAEGIIENHPTLDCVVLNAGLQRGINFTRPADIDPLLVQQEINTNYTSYVLLTAAFLPHLRARAPEAGALVAVSSGLALVPLPRCANYCATKAALHSLVWSLRAQLKADPGSAHISVVEIVPPAVQTELHEQQEDMRAAGQANIGITIEEYMQGCWPGLESGEEEILVGPIRDNFSGLEDGKRVVFRGWIESGRLPK